ncbi:flagellar motor switch phosphatase FliY [Alteribacter aurantiacus]|uniref:flagellar motor switch phosphatase FliY n=1 Tax=Alteribacter aurantiacus TaxID=254410 RepID=UPI0003F7B874|nr:flagellar motor switch phosphatase FliY [Alteribacter aurantiacus]
MTDDMLSQEEINALLNGMNETKSDGTQGIVTEDYLSGIEQDALGEIGNISFGSAATALSTLLNEKVDITTPKVTVIRKENLDEEFPQPHVAVHVKYTTGFEGVNLMVIKTTDAAIIADLMLGGDGLNPDKNLSDMHISAVQEAMNQMMGSASTSMSTIFNKRVDISPPGIDLLDLSENIGLNQMPDGDVLGNISFHLKVGELIDSKMMQLVSISFAKEMVEELMNPGLDSIEVAASNELSTESSPQQPEIPREVKPSPGLAEEQEPSYESETLDYSSGNLTQRTADVAPVAFSEFGVEEGRSHTTEVKNLDMLLDIPLEVTVELGRTKRSIKDILELSQGSIIELDKLAGEPVDVLVNQKLIAKGEVVVIDENFGVRVTDIVSQRDRINKLK